MTLGDRVRLTAIRYAALGGIAGVFMLLVVMCGAVSTSPRLAGATAPIGVSGPMWAAYRAAAGLQCNVQGSVIVGAEDLGATWTRPDPVLVAVIGMLESAHGTAVRSNAQFAEFEPTVDAFGHFAGPIRSMPLYDPADFHAAIPDDPKLSTVWDTDGGRWDGNPWLDHAVGPTQTLPSFLSRWGTDGDLDGVVDPHSVWDATATTAAFFCVGKAGGMTAAEMLKAYSNDDEYVAAVIMAYPEMAQMWSGTPALDLPGGAPLVRDPAAQRRWGWTARQARLPDPLLAALFDSVADAGLPGGGLGIADGDVACDDELCLWGDAKVPSEVIDEWQTLNRLGVAAPLLTPKGDAVLVEGLLPESGWTVAWPVPSAASRPTQKLPYPVFPPRRGTVAFPVPTAPWPVTPITVPDRLEWHVAPGAPVWGDVSASDGGLTIPTPVLDVDVYAPVAGRVAGGGGCASVIEPSGWTWRLCGLAATSATQVDGGSQGWTGQRLGFTAADTLRVTLTGPGGVRACPQALTRRWSAAAAAPTGNWSLRRPDQIVSAITRLWTVAEDTDVLATARAEAEEAAEALVVDLFESCMPPEALPSSFRDRR